MWKINIIDFKFLYTYLIFFIIILNLIKDKLYICDVIGLTTV